MGSNGSKTGYWIAIAVLAIMLFSSFITNIGLVTALFSGLAMGGVIVALVMQSQELGLQRQELRLTRQELSRSAEAQETSAGALAEQSEALRLTAQISAYAALMENSRRRLEAGLVGQGGTDAS